MGSVVSRSIYSCATTLLFRRTASGSTAWTRRLVKAVIEAESDFDPRGEEQGRGGGSDAANARDRERAWHKDPYDPSENIEGGCQAFKAASYALLRGTSRSRSPLITRARAMSKSTALFRPLKRRAGLSIGCLSTERNIWGHSADETGTVEHAK